MLNFLTNKGLKIFLNSHKTVKNIAEILDISLKNGEVRSKILLKGETEPVSISLNCKINGNTLCVTNVNTSKKWLTELADIFKERYAQIDLGKYKGAAEIAKYLL
ncbi:MAG: hypothetical protein LBB74_09060 [Chitinispirillales bacterium]|jgi:hypothetical protein|nr:hypothetical protein [Chitinispirillales bacterium]